ncbi:MAG: monovalent cation/H(+) antiporter subunit G [Acidobacteria bacterium]|nr:monovalent cation/H(+) antiporter subunit G [Acidobacteriota bacterium]
MSGALAVASWVLLAAGSVFAVVGGVGIVRLPDFFTRMHGAGITDTMGAALILGGLLCQSPDWQVAVKLLMILAFLFITSPTSGHALARAALANGLKPRLDERETEATSSTP